MFKVSGKFFDHDVFRFFFYQIVFAPKLDDEIRVNGKHFINLIKGNLIGSQLMPFAIDDEM